MNRKDIKVSDIDLRESLYNGRQAQEQGLVDSLGTYGVVYLNNTIQDTHSIVSLGQDGLIVQGI